MTNLGINIDFPIFKHHPSLVFLDNAATTQKPSVVINAEKEFYETTYANIHRATYDIAVQATDLFEGVRSQAADFIGANAPGEIVFTRNASEALNLAAYVIGQSLTAGDELLISVAGHHSNVLPWMRLAQEKKATIKWVEITKEGRLDIDSFKKNLSARTKVVVFEHVSNVLGYVNPVQDLSTMAHAVGALVVVDAAQSSCRMPINVQTLDVDFMAFSGHKMYGPTGSGFLYGKQVYLASAEPLLVGGGTIKKVTRQTIEWEKSPWRFEAGTPDIAGVVGLGACLTYLKKVGMGTMWQHDQELTAYIAEQLACLPFLKLYGPKVLQDRAAIFSFLIEVDGQTLHSHDVAEICNKSGVAIRGGHHCAQLLMQALGVEDVNRASFGAYNTTEDVDVLVAALNQAFDTFKKV